MLKLTIGFSQNPRIQPLADGTVKPKDIDLKFIFIDPANLFYRNLKNEEFDVSEMSISSFSMTKERGDGSRWQWSGLPVFLSKAFHWLSLFVNTGAKINELKDFAGKKVGMPDYNMTAAVWMKAVLRELYGIGPKDIVWFNGRTAEHSHGGELGLDQSPPTGIDLHWLTDKQFLDVMLDKGELDAAIGVIARQYPGIAKPIDRHGGTTIEGNPRIRRLFPDFGRQIISEFYLKTGVIPVNHMVIVKNKVLEKEPWVAMELFKAFQQSKEVAYERAMQQGAGYLLFLGDEIRRQTEVFGEDPFPLGLKANRKMLEMLFRGSAEQGLTKGLSRVDDLFHTSVRET